MERKHILRRNRPQVSNFLSHRIFCFFKIMVFGILGKSLHHQMILGPPDGSLDFFLNTRGFWLNGLRRLLARVLILPVPCLAAFCAWPLGSREIRPWRPILVFVGRSRGLPENPKSMGWEIHGVGNPWKIHRQIQDFWDQNWDPI